MKRYTTRIEFTNDGLTTAWVVIDTWTGERLHETHDGSEAIGLAAHLNEDEDGR